MKTKISRCVERDSRILIYLFILFLLTFGYFFNCGGWNQNARYDAVFSFVEPGTSDYHTFHIDRFVSNPNAGYSNTGDWSYYNGHFYSNKAPGASFLGICVYTVVFHVEQLFSIPWNHPYIEILNAYLINFFVTVLPTALGILFFFKLLVLRGFTYRRAAVFALVLAFSTCVFPYSTSFWGHTTAMSFLIFSLYCVERETAFSIVLAGFFAGIATLTDYLALFGTVGIGLLVLLNDRRKLLHYVAGGLPIALLLLGYNQICFGSPFAMSTKYTNQLFLQHGKLMGVFNAPSANVFIRLLFGLWRGIFTSMPVLLLAVPGFCYCLKKGAAEVKMASVGISIIIVSLLLNSSFNGWDGGNSICARYLIVSLPFWVLLVSSLPARKGWNSLLAGTALFSGFNMLAATAVCTQPNRFDMNPLYGTVYSHFFQGIFDIQKYPVRLQKFNPDWPKFAHLTSWNAGELLGFNGFLSLVPLLFAVSIFLYFILKNKRTRPIGAQAVLRPMFDSETIENAKWVLENKKVSVFVVAYNAESTVSSVLRRIPEWVSEKLVEIFVIDDSSTDGTVANLKTIKLSNREIPFNIFKTPYNLGYGGNQKMGYAYAIQNGFDIVVMLHGDGQYAPEYLPAILAEYADPANDAVFGTRFGKGCSPLKGGMPLYKWFGNRVLTKIQNYISGADMSEMHSGYRSYRCECLSKIPFEKNSNDFHFDEEIILQHVKSNFKIKEVPIPTFYGDEICYVNGIQYAWNCLKSLVKFRFMDWGIFYDPKFDIASEKSRYTVKLATTSLHHHVRNLDVPEGARIADIGGGDGVAVAAYFSKEHFVTCVDVKFEKSKIPDGVEMVRCDLDGEWTFYDGRPFDIVFALDVLEQLQSPENAATELFRITRANGRLYASVGNVAYFIPRVMLMFGEFNYSLKGILDFKHKRLMTVDAFRRLLENAGFKVQRIIGFGPPLKDLYPESRFFAFADFVAAKFARFWPKMFAFNVLVVCERPDSVDDLTRKTFVPYDKYAINE